MVAWELDKVINRTLHNHDENDGHYDHNLIIRLDGMLLNDLSN